MSRMDLMEHWKLVRFGEVATFTKKPRDLRYSEYNEVPFVPMDLIPIAKLFSEKFTLKTNDELSSGTYFEPGDILLAKITPSFENGKQCIIEELPTPFGIATTEVVPIREVVGVSDKCYLFYYLLLPDVRTLLAGRMQGTTGRQRLSKETLVNLEIPLPPLSEQRAITHVLQTIQEAKAARQRELALERERKAALMDYLFSHGTKGEPRKQTGIGEIPESWEVMEFGDLIDIKHGYAFKSEYFTESGDIVLTPGNFLITGGLYWGAKTKFTSQEYPAEFLFEPGDLVVVMTDLTPSTKLLGASAFIPKGKRVLHNQRIGKIIVRDSLTSKDFLYWVFNSKAFRKHMALTATGSTVRHTSPSRIKDYEFGLPSNEQQQEIAKILQAFDTKIASLEQEAARLDELFHAMLDELMTGQRSALPLIDAEMSNWKTLSNQE